MADKRIDELEEALSITATDLFVLEQANTAKKLTGQTMTNFLLALANGHGGISGITKTGSAGTNPVVDTYTIAFADLTTATFTVTNGVKGDTGSTGPQGPKGDDITVSSASVTYQVGNSGTTPPTGTWQSSVPTVPQGSYLWARTIVNYSDGNGTTAYAVSRMGVDGSGSVSSVCGISPDGTGNVVLTASDVGALPDSYTAPVTSVNGLTGTVSISPASISAAELDSDSKVLAAQASSAIVSKSASFTLALANAGRFIQVTASSAVTVTIPTNASVAFPVGTEIEIAQMGAGAVTFAGASGVTINSLDSAVVTSGQYAVACLKKIDTNVWLLAGALA